MGIIPQAKNHSVDVKGVLDHMARLQIDLNSNQNTSKACKLISFNNEYADYLDFNHLEDPEVAA